MADTCSRALKRIFVTEADAEATLAYLRRKRLDGGGRMQVFACGGHFHFGHTDQFTARANRAKQRLKPKRKTRRRREAPTFEQADWDEATMLLWARARGRCEHCGRDLNGTAERHHRQRRAVGGDRLSNLMLVLPECHHAAIHAHPELAREQGWIVSAFVDDPASVPMMQWGEQAVILDDTGCASAHH